MTTPSQAETVISSQHVPLQKRSNYRWTLAIFVLLITFMSFMDRVNLAIAAPEIMKEFHFTKIQIGMMQTAFFLSYAFFQIPSGLATEYLGHRRMVALAMAWWSLFTSLTAFCGRFSVWIIVRVLFGVGEAPVYPGLNSALAGWFPRKERGKAMGFLVTGSCLGQIVGLPLAGLIMVTWGWRAVFVSFGMLGLVLAVCYYALMRTDPQESKFVNAAELEYIADGRPISKSTKRAMAPWKDFLRSGQFWAIACQFSMADYINYVFISWLPVYLLEAHQFSLKQMGFVAAVPFMGPAIGGMSCGFIADYVVKKGWATSKCRSWFGGIGLLFCCCALYMTATTGDRWLTVMWLTIALGGLGFTFNSSWASCADIGGRFSGTVAGWINFWGNLCGAAGPTITALVVTRYSWRAAILVTAVAGIIGAVSWLFVKPDIALKNTA
jgi:ACS family glucarate transporter-like MFS transporter